MPVPNKQGEHTRRELQNDIESEFDRGYFTQNTHENDTKHARERHESTRTLDGSVLCLVYEYTT